MPREVLDSSGMPSKRFSCIRSIFVSSAFDFPSVFISPGPKGHSELLSYQWVHPASCVVIRPSTIENKLFKHLL